MSETTAIAVRPGPTVDLSGEAAAGGWEIVLAVAIAAGALAYLLRTWGFIGRRKQPGCTQCAGGCGGSGSLAGSAACGGGDDVAPVRIEPRQDPRPPDPRTGSA